MTFHLLLVLLVVVLGAAAQVWHRTAALCSRSSLALALNQNRITLCNVDGGRQRARQATEYCCTGAMIAIRVRLPVAAQRTNCRPSPDDRSLGLKRLALWPFELW